MNMRSLIIFCAALVCSTAHAQNVDSPPADAPASAPVEEVRAQPPNSEAALRQAESAYEYGDVPLLVESARLITDGTLASTEEQMAQALRYLGIGLYVTGRIPGSKAAFEKLLQLRPNTVLNPATTRPEIITFFFELRRERIRQLREAHEAGRPPLLWNFLPPLGQFQNGDRVKGWVLLTAEATTFVAATTTFAIVKYWDRADGTVYHRPGDPEGPDRTDTANTLRTINRVMVPLCAAIYAYGVVDGLVGRSGRPSDAELLSAPPPPVTLTLLPNGAGLNVTF